jgi:predicted nuclease of predicted toxin-antitoxin system
MIRLLLDQGLAVNTSSILRQRGFDAVHVMEIGLSTAEDAEILAAARNQNRCCVTLDHDFHTHLAIAAAGDPSVILLRIDGVASEEQADLITSICERFATELDEGAAISADGRSIRIRRLPLR